MSDAIRRRSFLSMGLAAPVLGGMSACSRGRDSLERRGSGGRTRVTFWSSIRGSHEVVQAFNESQDDIEVVYSQIPDGGSGGYANIRNAARAGNAPDVITLEYPQVPEFAVDGIAQNLTDLMSDELHSKILPEALARTTYEDRIYSVPNDLEPLMLHYRRDLFEERGYEVPTTWAQFAELGQRIRDESDGERIANFPTNGGTYFAGFVQQSGGSGSTLRTTPGTWGCPTPGRVRSRASGRGSSTMTS